MQDEREEYIEKLEKALDKACEELSHKDTIAKERWKEYLLNEAE